MPRKTRKTAPKKTPPTAPATLPARTPGGKFGGKELKFKANTLDAFLAWYADRKPRILAKGKYQHVELTPKQIDTLGEILASDGDGGFQHGMSMLIWPRRHGKSNLLRLVVLWLFDTRDNHTVQLWGNSEAHSRRVQFKPLGRIIENTPALRKRMPETRGGLLREEIVHGSNGSRILAMVGGSVVFGDQIDLLYVDDFHHQTDLKAVNALQAALLDQDNALMLIGSNVDPIDGHCHQLQKLAKTDPGIYCHHLEYMDWLHYEDHAPAWIDRIKAKRLEKTTLPSEFDRDILGKRSQAQNALFEAKHIEVCRSNYRIPVGKDFRELIQGRTCKIGAGLDRAKDLFGEATGHDNTIFTVIAKVAKPDGEPEFFILDQVHVIPNNAQNIKAHIRQAHDRYKLDNLTLEDYQAMDIEPWCVEQNIPTELIPAHSSRQNVMFPEFHRIVKEGRLHFPGDMAELQDEMKSFQYTLLSNNKYSFGAAGKGHDDRVFSLGWAIYSLRQEVLANYVLGNIQCMNKKKSRQFCILLGGDLELSCSRECFAFQQVKDMLQEFKKFQTESALTIGPFYQRYVKVTGAVLYQAA